MVIKMKISAAQAILLLFVSRVFNIFNYIPIFSGNVEPSATLIGNIIALLINLAIVIPVSIMFKRNGNKDILSIAYNKHKVIGIIVCSIYFLFNFIILIGTIFGFEFFMTNAVYPNASVFFIIITICMACFFCAKHGIEGIARTSTIVFVLLILGIIFITFASFKSINLLNIKPIISDVPTTLYKAVSSIVSKGSELIILILIFPKINGSFKKCSVWLIVSSAIILELISFLVASVLGEFAYTQMFPYFTLASVVETSIFQRLDSVHMVLWVFISFVKITLGVYVSNYCLQAMLPKSKHKYTLFPLFIVVTSLAILVGFHPEIFTETKSTFPTFILIGVVIIPLLLCIKKHRKGKKKNEEKTFAVSVNTD